MQKDRLLDSQTQDRIDTWLEGDYDSETKDEIRRLERENPHELKASFENTLSFGTGGIRALMGVGPARMNIYTIRRATQGLSNFLIKKHGTDKLRAVISYDSRINSLEFAQETARVFLGNGFEVFLFKDQRPTPELSFACRALSCHAGVMITASHNPPSYNGYKAYGEDGGQIPPPEDQLVVEAVQAIEDLSEIKLGQLSDTKLQTIEPGFDSDYIHTLLRFKIQKELVETQGELLNIIYTNIHGSAIYSTPPALNAWGFPRVVLVDDQAKPDGKFPTVTAPNPEESIALELGTQKLLATQADLLLANDPDGDRLGVAIRHMDKAILLNGQEIALLITDYIVRQLKGTESWPERPAIVKSLVTSDLIERIAEKNEIACINVLPGFKYIAQLMTLWESNKNHSFLLGLEESHGYLYGDYCREKDGVQSACLIAEIALDAKVKGETLIDRLNALYKKYGFMKHEVFSFALRGRSAKTSIEKIMDELRRGNLPEFSGVHVISQEDLKESDQLHLQSDILKWTLSDEITVIIRPSGTEPKIKCYLTCSAPYEDPLPLYQTEDKLDLIICRLRDHFNQLIQEEVN